MIRYLLHGFSIVMAGAALLALLARYISPESIWFLSPLALLLPGLLLLNFLGLLIQIYYKEWRAMVPTCIVIILSLSILPRIFAIPSQTSPTDNEADITLVTANVRGFKDQSYRSIDDDAIRAQVENWKADILLLQEAGPAKGKRERRKTVYKAGEFKDQSATKGKTLTAFSKSKIKTRATEFVGYNGYVVMDVESTLGNLRIINVHLQSNRITDMAGQLSQDTTLEDGVGRLSNMLTSYARAAKIRAKQASDIRQQIEKSPYPVIVGGDFNDVPSSYVYDRICTDRLYDAWSYAGLGIGTTFTGPLPGLRIDFVLVDTALQVTDVSRLHSDFSDHRPLRVKLTTK